MAVIKKNDLMIDTDKHNKKEIIGFVDEYDGLNLRGWAYCVDDSEPVKLTLLINNKKRADFLADEYRGDLLLQGIKEGKASYNIPLDLKTLLKENDSDQIEIDVISAEEKVIPVITKNIENINISQNILYHVDIKEYENISGWIADYNNQNIAIKLDVWVNGEIIETVVANLPREDIGSTGLTNTNHGFHINLARLTQNQEFIEVRLTYEYLEKVEVLSSTYLTTFQSKITAFTNLQTQLRERGYEKESAEANFLIKSLLPGIIDLYRKSKRIEQNEIRQCSEVQEDNSLAVIIPVYKGVEETASCIGSVLKSKNEKDFELIVISDCSPDPLMLPELLTLKKKYGFELLSNETNLGFVGTVNKGMKYAKTSDVILLNSDTVVADHWLDNIHKVAYKSKTIGTVTPMSNNATICSFPGFCVDNELPKGFDVNSIALKCEDNKASEVDLPTAHGYCMYIKRQVLNEVGVFDEQKWGKGYAEENDFSLRASKLGWRHVMTNKTFVHHLGAVSFAENAEGFIEHNLEKLNALYPDYPLLVQNFINKDPARLQRNELAEKLLFSEIDSAKVNLPAKGKSILFVSLSLGGGTKVATDDLAGLLHQEDQSVFYLTPIKNGRYWRVESTDSNVFSDYKLDTELDLVLNLLKKLDVWHIHFHNTIGFNKNIWDLPGKLGCEYDITVHDYYAVCPRVNLVSIDDKYCGEQGVEQCQSCLMSIGVHGSSELKFTDFNKSILDWRGFFYDKFSHARKVFTPSRDTKERILKYFDIDNVIHHYHPEEIKSVVLNKQKKEIGDKINLGFIGAIGPHKGIQVVKDMALEIAKQNLPINLKIIGYTSDDDFFKDFEFVSISGPYKLEDISTLVVKENIDAFFLTSVWPETFSYTLSEVLRENMFVFAFNLGAIAERLDPRFGITFDVDGKIEDHLKTILKTFTNQSDDQIKLTIGQSFDSILKEYYLLG